MTYGAQGARHDVDNTDRAEAKIGSEYKTLTNSKATLDRALVHQTAAVKSAKDHVAYCKAEQAASADRFELVTAQHSDDEVKVITDAFDARRKAREDIAQQIRDLQSL